MHMSAEVWCHIRLYESVQNGVWVSREQSESHPTLPLLQLCGLCHVLLLLYDCPLALLSAHSAVQKSCMAFQLS